MLSSKEALGVTIRCKRSIASNAHKNAIHISKFREEKQG